MKHLLNGVAIAAVLAIAAPAWAQAPMTPSSSTAPKPAAAAKPAAAPADAAPAKPRHKRMASHRAMRRGPPSMTQQLNQAELARIQSGGPPASGLSQTESTMPAKIGSPKQP